MTISLILESLSKIVRKARNNPCFDLAFGPERPVKIFLHFENQYCGSRYDEKIGGNKKVDSKSQMGNEK